MKTNKLIKSIAFTLMLMCINLKIQAQCSFVKTELNGEINAIALPCNFPMLNFAKATAQEKLNFETEVAEWKIKNKGFENLAFKPITTNEYFEIDQATYNTFSEKNKAIVAAMPYFYKIKTETNTKIKTTK